MIAFRWKKLARIAVAAVAATGLGATLMPGSALAAEQYQSRHFMNSWYVHPATHTGASLLELQQQAAAHGWSPIARGTLDGKNLRQFKRVKAAAGAVAPWGGCMDSRGVASGGRPGVEACNQGDYQIWQIFRNSNGSLTFKNLGSWTGQGRHLCLGVNSSKTVQMVTCNANSSLQQWV